MPSSTKALEAATSPFNEVAVSSSRQISFDTPLPPDTMILAFVICLIFFELDIWLYLGYQYVSRPYRMSRKDAACRSFSGVYGIEGNYFYNRYGDLCSILKLLPLNSNRVDPDKLDVVEANDKKFLNALPCPVQIVGYTYNYNLEKYYKSMLKYAQRLPKQMKSMLIAHLDFYSDYRYLFYLTAIVLFLQVWNSFRFIFTAKNSA